MAMPLQVEGLLSPQTLDFSHERARQGHLSEGLLEPGQRPHRGGSKRTNSSRAREHEPPRGMQLTAPPGQFDDAVLALARQEGLWHHVEGHPDAAQVLLVIKQDGEPVYYRAPIYSTPLSDPIQSFIDAARASRRDR
eukprot:jgi/Chlat1/1561/Chrsp123S08668